MAGMSTTWESSLAGSSCVSNLEPRKSVHCLVTAVSPVILSFSALPSYGTLSALLTLRTGFLSLRAGFLPWSGFELVGLSYNASQSPIH
jgi:hypothetical protein